MSDADVVPLYPLKLRAIRVQQPLGLFYVVSIPAHILLQVAYSDVLSASLAPDNVGYKLEGTQREAQSKRLIQIGDYIDRTDSAFPNSIILAANFRPDTGLMEGEDAESPAEWTVSQQPDGCYTLEIPSSAKLAAIVDGQHRLFGFAEAKDRARLGMELLCSVYVDLPKPFQAQLFATINSTQKRVDKSLTYELFGYNISEENESFWTPDKLAVFLTRKLNTETDSALYGRIVVAPRRDPSLKELLSKATWKVSTAVVVDGILRLITTNPKRDSNEMHSVSSSRRSVLRGKFTTDKSPLRNIYLDGDDVLIYTMVLNYLRACDLIFWERAKPDSFIFRTAGVQALFLVLRTLARRAVELQDARLEYFVRALDPAKDIDFSDAEYRSSSGAGSGVIRRAIEHAVGLNTPAR
jgi:DNA phosphorothioation-associated DGQHR protein 1